MANARRSGAGKIVGRILIVFFTTLLMIVVALYLIMLVIAKGPSESARKVFVNSVQETSAIKFLANWYYSDEQIAEYLSSKHTMDEATNAELIQIKTPAEQQEAGETARPAEELVEVEGETYKGYLLKIADPSRVFVGVSGPYGEEYEGKRVKDIIESYGAMAGTNAGGFVDTNGVGNGGVPLDLVISEGELKWGGRDTTYDNVIGFDNNNILHVGTMTGQQALDMGIRDAVCWSLGPTLVVNGKAANETESLGGGFNPRTSIGQTADGTVLMLVVEGRQTSSIGATYDDLVSIMLQNGAVNAANLDGGSSTVMYINGELVNVCSSLYGPRRMPTCWLVKQPS